MADIYDIFSKKKVPPKEKRFKSYLERNKSCLQNIAEKGSCSCDMCKDKLELSKRLYDIVRYLCKDYTEKTGKELYVSDALEIVLIVAGKIKNHIK